MKLYEFLEKQIKLRRLYINPNDFYDKIIEELIKLRKN